MKKNICLLLVVTFNFLRLEEIRANHYYSNTNYFSYRDTTTASEKEKSIRLLADFFSLLSTKEEQTTILKKIREIANRQTTIQKAGALFNNQEFQNFLYANKIYVCRFLDWKDPSSEMVQIAKHTAGKFLSSKKIPVLNTKQGQQPIEKTYRSYGKILQRSGLTLFNIDVDCDCYYPVVIDTGHADEAKKLVQQMGFIFEHWTAEW